MTIQECYLALGGNYADVMNRLPSVSLIQRFLAKFPDDPSMGELRDAFQAGQRQAAFRAVHTLKGVCGNLGLEKLGNSASRLAELLRPESDTIPEGADLLLEEIEQDYAQTVNAIHAFLG